MSYWLLKSEPSVFGIEHLIASPNQTTPWDGVRNYQARNWMRDAMRLGDQVFLYHSNCDTPGIVGIMEIVREGYPDESALDPQSPYFDPKSTPDNPRWYRVDARHVRRLERLISLEELKRYPELDGMPLTRRGNRLSVMPVTEQQWRFILSLEKG
jgi:predicted RNA-binding protein with PUA-like domain